MFKNINSEKYAKSILDVDYWKTRTFEEEIKAFYKEENKKLKAEIERLEKLLDSEHHCNQNCFAEHVLQAIQSDYDSHNGKYRESFIRRWYWNLSNEYPWLKSLYIIDGKIYFK